MSTTPDRSCFIFLIKTDNYAGNYERKMCAFMTGVVGGCGAGDIAAGLFKNEYPGHNEWEDKVVQVPDDHGCYRPTSIWSTNSQDVAIFLEDRPTPEEIEFLRKRALLFILDPRDGVGHSGDDSKPRIKIKGFELLAYKVEVTEKQIQSWPPMTVLEA